MEDRGINSANRPRFLNPLAIRMPVGAVTSILHRISGVSLFLALPPAAWLFAASLESPERFSATLELLGSWQMRTLLALLLWAFLHHFFAGLRFLLLDAAGVERAAARRLAWLATLAAPTVAGLLLVLEAIL